ncbi:hypothetical protein D3C75_1197990 [compost metagenome]
MVTPSSRGALVSSISRVMPPQSSCWSPSAPLSSSFRLYLSPEQPPPSTRIRKPATGLSVLLMKRVTALFALSVMVIIGFSPRLRGGLSQPAVQPLQPSCHAEKQEKFL